MNPYDGEHKLFVGNLGFETEDEQLQKAFGSFGELVFWRVCHDESTGNSRGYGYVSYSSEEAAEKAIKAMNASTLGDRKIRVRSFLSREQHEANKKAAYETKVRLRQEKREMKEKQAALDKEYREKHGLPEKKENKPKEEGAEPEAEEWLVRTQKKVKALKKKLGQIEQLQDKIAKKKKEGEELVLERGQKAKLDTEEKVREELERLERELAITQSVSQEQASGSETKNKKGSKKAGKKRKGGTGSVKKNKKKKS